MRIFKTNNNRPSESLTAAHMRLNEIISEEKDDPELEMQPTDDASQTSKKPLLLTESALSDIVIPKVSKTGQKYFEIETTSKKYGHAKAPKSPETAESRVSVLMTDQLSTESFQDWVMGFESPQCDTIAQKHEGPEVLRGWPMKRISQTLPHEETSRLLDRRTTASVRPLFLGTKARAETAARDRHVQVIRGRTAPLRSHPVTPGPVPSVLPPALPVNKASPIGSDPVKIAAVAQPNSQRMNRHPPVLSRTSSDVSGLRFSRLSQKGVRSVSDSPGPPPPRSPLRLSIPSESLGEMLNMSTPRTSPGTCETIKTPVNEEQAIRVTKEAAVTYDTRAQTDDELPFFLRPGSSGTSSDVFCTNSSEFKVHPSKPLELIDAMVKASQQNTSRRRLRRARPEGPRSFDLNVSHSQASPERNSRTDGYCTSPLSIKRTTSMGEMSENYRVIATTASPSPRISHRTRWLEWLEKWKWKRKRKSVGAKTVENPRLVHNALAIFKHQLCIIDAAPNRRDDRNPPNDTTDKMRVYEDSFSGQKIYPGKGKLYVRGDSKIFRFQNGKSESLFLQRKNPRKISWTVLYRRQHKKGISEEVAKKRTRRTVKNQRAIVGASLDVIKERRSQRPEARAAARAAAIKEGKAKKTETESEKKANKAKNAASAAKGQAGKIASKQGAKGPAVKVAAKSR
ncbi:hypothetical protein E4T39_06738 [Aureobasidium subglaciale]|nr:hypothetical protein E4T39_06738 [Aureobasidium subglaciale]